LVAGLRWSAAWGQGAMRACVRGISDMLIVM